MKSHKTPTTTDDLDATLEIGATWLNGVLRVTRDRSGDVTYVRTDMSARYPSIHIDMMRKQAE